MPNLIWSPTALRVVECDGLHVQEYSRILHFMPDDLSQSATFRRNVAKICARGQAFDDWARDIDALAAQQHMHLKLSVISVCCTPGQATLATLKP